MGLQSCGAKCDRSRAREGSDNYDGANGYESFFRQSMSCQCCMAVSDTSDYDPLFNGDSGTPHISALSPSSVVAGSGDLTLTVTGSNFIPGAPGTGSFVNFDGNGATTKYVSSTTLTAVIPASNFVSAGSHSVQVFNSWTLSSNLATFTVTSGNPVPTITSLSPSNATAGGPAFQLVVNGSNFVSSSVVHWGSAVLSTTYVSATQITAAVPAADIAAASAVMVSVVNPSPGGGTSNSYTFTVDRQRQCRQLPLCPPIPPLPAELLSR